MEKKQTQVGQKSREVQLDTLSDLIQLNKETLKGVVEGTIDNRKAALIFTGSRTITGQLKLAIEAVRLGIAILSGVPMGETKKLPFKTE